MVVVGEKRRVIQRFYAFVDFEFIETSGESKEFDSLGRNRCIFRENGKIREKSLWSFFEQVKRCLEHTEETRFLAGIGARSTVFWHGCNDPRHVGLLESI